MVRDGLVKQEAADPTHFVLEKKPTLDLPLMASSPSPIGSCSDSDSDSDLEDLSEFDQSRNLRNKRLSVPNIDDGVEGRISKKRKVSSVVLPPGFLDPLPRNETPISVVRPLTATPVSERTQSDLVVVRSCKQFWKAGDYDGGHAAELNPNSFGMDHLRVHPKFLHSNATSHKWALGALAELLDNSLDEVCNGATYVNVDELENQKDGNRMLLVEDNGGGMAPDVMRQCMSLGYSAKSKMANTIGQYGNGFKTSTMRLGADVVVFSRFRGRGGSPMQSIGLLSYTFLRSTGKEDIVVPIVDYEKRGPSWTKMIRSSSDDWDRNLKTILQWSPYLSEQELLQQLDGMKDQGTRIILYNLWEDDEGHLELDFDSDKHDIQLRGVNRDEKKIRMAKKYPNSRHFLTYQHSLRSYASILYLRLPPGFRIILRGKDVKHHNLVNDMMEIKNVSYKPKSDEIKDSNISVNVTIGFVKDAKDHIDIQGFNVYHKNRLIKPFWRVWNAAGSGGRGVIGVLEANFVEPAHDKQGFERTTVLSRLESRLVVMQKNYWHKYSSIIGYAGGRQSKDSVSPDRGGPRNKRTSCPNGKTPDKDKLYSYQNKSFSNDGPGTKSSVKSKSKASPAETPGADESRNVDHYSKSSGIHSYQGPVLRDRSHKVGGQLRKASSNIENANSPANVHTGSSTDKSNLKSTGLRTNVSGKNANPEGPTNVHTGGASSNKVNFNSTEEVHTGASGTTVRPNAPANIHTGCLKKLKEENDELKERLKNMENSTMADLLKDVECERKRSKELEQKLQEAEQKIKEMDNEQEALIDVFSEERERREVEELKLRKKLKDASTTIGDLLEKVKQLERKRRG